MSEVADPGLRWVLEWIGAAVWLTITATLLVRSARARTLTPGTLLVLAGLSMWWQEWALDWGYYLIWSPDFVLQHGWVATGDWTTPNRPWLVVMAGYGWYWGTIFAATSLLAARVRRRRPHWSRLRAFVVVAIPVDYAWNVLVVGTATAIGWWSYTEPRILTTHVGNGGFSFAYPILMLVAFSAAMSWIFGARADDGRFSYERRIGLRPGASAAWWYELRRLLAAVVLANVGYFLLVILPGVVLREAAGPASTLVP